MHAQSLLLLLLLSIALVPTAAATARPAAPKAELTFCSPEDFSPPCWSDRILPRRCANLGSAFNDAITSYRVRDGCCAFYRHANCKDKLFEARNREHGKLGKAHNDQISSYMCSPNCNGVPG